MMHLCPKGKMFSSDPVEAEKQYIACIEAWRQNLNLGKINLLGHR